MANREWQRGTAPTLTVDVDDLTAQVRRYLADCRANRSILNPAHHPTEAGALKIVFHRSDAEKTAIRAAYRHYAARELARA